MTPHIWVVWIRHCILKEIFPSLCLGLINSLSGFTASIDPLLSVLVDCLKEVISSTDFGSHLWSHPRFRFLARFYFLDVGCYSRDENIIETRYTKRYVWFVRKIINFWLNFVGKTWLVNAVTSPSSSSWDDGLVVNLVIYFNDNWKMVGATSRLC